MGNSYEEREAVARAKLRAIYENSNSKERLRLANTLGFKGSPRVKRDSVQRLISPKGKKRSRRITEDKFSTINRSYGQLTKPGGRFSKKDIIVLDAQQKADVTEYFKPYIIIGYDENNNRKKAAVPKIRNNKPSPFLVINTEYRIIANVFGILLDQKTNVDEGRQFTIYHDGKSNDFATLAEMLQKRVEATVRESIGAYRIYGIAFSLEGGKEMIKKLEPELGKKIGIPNSEYDEYNIQIYSIKSTGKEGKEFQEVEV